MAKTKKLRFILFIYFFIKLSGTAPKKRAKRSFWYSET